MSRITNAEQKLRHLTELNTARRKKYVELHGMKRFNAELTGERIEQLNKALAECGITKKQFLENAIDQFLKGVK